MGIRKIAAQITSGVLTWGLKNVAKRPAANFPGKMALKIDPNIIGEMAPKITEGSVMVVGTNGKTTISNLLADTIEAHGKSVMCNRSGANLDNGIASTLLQAKKGTQWGVFETDELWLRHTLPQLKASYVLLLNLFRDQLDRYGEIDATQKAIIEALEKSPTTTLLYNADDPQCSFIADHVPNPSLAFGTAESMGLGQERPDDVEMCQKCSSIMEYDFCQYGQLGKFHCPSCGFERQPLDIYAQAVEIGDGITFQIAGPLLDEPVTIHTKQTGPYMVYNLLATYMVAQFAGVSGETFQRALDAFDPQNGRLQEVQLLGRSLLLNLAKNPTGFNQNLKIITSSEGKKAVAFFVNDAVGDGMDVSWLWDCDFEDLCNQEDLVAYAGGLRRHDLQNRLKYAGINAKTIGGVNEMIDEVITFPADWNMYAIANYTALPEARAEAMARAEADGNELRAGDVTPVDARQPEPPLPPYGSEPLRIMHVFPELLNLHADAGNVKVLAKRCAWRGQAYEVNEVHYGEKLDFSTADIVFLAGGPDRENLLAYAELAKARDELADFVERGGVLLAVCGGFQMLGRNWLAGTELVEGLGILDMEVTAPVRSDDRFIDNIILSSPLATHPVVGYENHAARTHLGEGLQPFGTIISSVGKGNDGVSGADGALYRNCVGTYLHGPVLGKNPELADWLVSRALEQKTGAAPALAPLDDTVELRANAFMVNRLEVNSAK